MVDPQQWRRIQPILDEALTLPLHERRGWLDRACPDPELRAILERLVQAVEASGGLLDARSGVLLADIMRELEGDIPTPSASLSQSDRHGSAGEFLPGTILVSRYRVVSLLGRGGMSDVYRADDLKLGQAIALKFLAVHLRENTEYLRRLLQEARLARQISHPNVCRVYDVGEWEGRDFLSMEYIDGEDLASLIRRIGPLPRQKALDIARQLCAGLDAAHRIGIVHRDLKPANVMLDGRGQVRITDFGLAVASAHLYGRATRAGTPAYMAPEQLEGREATMRSDIYALGLVLYELFTGRRAFQAVALEELRRLQQESSPTNPSLLVEGFDLVVERAILRCLETDPALRPASARDVASLLPGGDPLVSALAAGETPSPDLVAAAGPVGTLSARAALTTLGATMAMLVVLLLLSDRASVIGWVAWPRSADALEDNAQGILARLGHDAKPVDRARLFWFDYAWMGHVMASDRSPGRWNVLRDPGQLAVFFFYRQALRPLVPLRPNGRVHDHDPVPEAGDAWMMTDLRGRLIRLQVLSDDAETPMDAAPQPDWSRLFHEAGLDPRAFKPIPPTRNPPVPAENRAAWTGVLREYGDYPVRVEAAAHRGKPVFFELVVPWDTYWDPGARAVNQAWTTFVRVPLIGYAMLALFATLTMGALALRNWLNGRGDRRGAFRLAAAVLTLRFGVWTAGGHHVPALSDEVSLMLIALGKSLTDAAAIWCFYLALEPYARRFHPRLLVSWTRLLRGNLGDSLVGRDILYGVSLATLVIFMWGQAYVCFPQALQMNAPAAPVPFPLGPGPQLFVLNSPAAQTLLGGRYLLEAIAGEALLAAGAVSVLMMVLLGLRLLLRSAWAVGCVFVVIVSLLGWPSIYSGYHPVGIACSFAGAIIICWAVRFGLVGVLVMWFCLHIWMDFPVTARLDAPHFGAGLVAVLLILGLAAFGARIASRRPRIPSAT